jgi:tight adherence protein C
MTSNVQVIVVVGAIFIAVGLVTLVSGSIFLRRQRIRGRLAMAVPATPNVSSIAPRKIIDRIDDKLVGLDSASRGKLRLELFRGGYFTIDAPKVFLVTRVVSILALPLVGYVLASLLVASVTPGPRFVLVTVLLFVGYVGPQAYLKHRQAQLLQAYRNVFPDFLDLLVVCIDSGLSFEAALARIGREFKTRSPEFAINLALLGSEIRSGRGTIEALDNLSDRLGLDEAKSFAMLLKQSIELGSDIADGLRSFADDMRDKRMARAETRANELPVKLTIPLGIFIFPVILILTLTPVLIQISIAFKKVAGG